MGGVPESTQGSGKQPLPDRKQCPSIAEADCRRGNATALPEEMPPPAAKKKRGPAAGWTSVIICCSERLLPLNGCAWFWRHVVADAVYGWNLCKDSVCNLHKDWPVDLLD